MSITAYQAIKNIFNVRKLYTYRRFVQFHEIFYDNELKCHYILYGIQNQMAIFNTKDVSYGKQRERKRNNE